MRQLFVLAGVGFLGLLLRVNVQAGPLPTKTPARQADQAQNEASLVTVTYSVADLIVPIAYNLDNPKTREEAARKKSPDDPDREQPARNAPEKEPKATQEEALIQLICSVVAPDSWQAGSRCTIRYVPLGMGLVIQQTKQAHQEIRALLAALRRLQEVEVAVEIRMLYLSEAAEEKILAGVELPSKNKVAFLDDVQQQALIEAVQKDKRIEVLQAPKLTLFNGQRGSIRVTDYQFFLTGVQASTTNGQTVWTPKNEPMEIGFHSSVCPTVSADRKSVFLDLQVKRTTLLEPVPLIPIQIPVPQVLEGPGAGTATLGQPVIFQMFIQQPQIATQVVDQKFSIPAGKTALIVAGKERRQTRTESAPAIVSQIPYLSRLFNNVSYARESCSTILLVTPRIIINDEQDAISGDTGAPLPPAGN